MSNYYKAGGLDVSDIVSVAKRAADLVKKQIREEAAEGVAPVARKQAAEGARSAVTPMIVGVGALSALSLILALRR